LAFGLGESLVVPAAGLRAVVRDGDGDGDGERPAGETGRKQACRGRLVLRTT